MARFSVIADIFAQGVLTFLQTTEANVETPQSGFSTLFFNASKELQAKHPDGTVNTIGPAAPAKFQSWAILAHTAAQGTEGDSLTTGSWVNRTLNTELYDPDGIVSLSSNQFTLSAGTYIILAAVPFHGTNRSQSRIYNVTTSSAVTTVLFQSVRSNDLNTTTSVEFGLGYITVSSGTNTFRLQSQVSTAAYGGRFANFSTEVYTLMLIIKV